MLLRIVLLSLLCVGAASAQQRDVQIEATLLVPGVWMLSGQGGNMLLVSGEEGSFLVDDQFAPLTEKIQAKIAELGAPAVEFLVNTHYHGDHTGGNENFGKSGAIIVAHENTRERMASDFRDEIFDRDHAAEKPEALPTVTFSESIRFYRYGHEVHAFHVERAHTDGDCIVHLPGSNVLDMGDVFFNGLYPFVDVSGGGSIDGMIAGVERGLELSDENTKIVPGHGAVAGKAELQAFRDLLVDVRDRVRAAIAEGKTLEQVQAMAPTAAYDDPWAKTWIDGPGFTRMVYLSLTRPN